MGSMTAVIIRGMRAAFLVEMVEENNEGGIYLVSFRLDEP